MDSNESRLRRRAIEVHAENSTKVRLSVSIPGILWADLQYLAHQCKEITGVEFATDILIAYVADRRLGILHERNLFDPQDDFTDIPIANFPLFRQRPLGRVTNSRSRSYKSLEGVYVPRNIAP